jgi:hypothetical protein
MKVFSMVVSFGVRCGNHSRLDDPKVISSDALIRIASCRVMF